MVSPSRDPCYSGHICDKTFYIYNMSKLKVLYHRSSLLHCRIDYFIVIFCWQLMMAERTVFKNRILLSILWRTLFLSSKVSVLQLFSWFNSIRMSFSWPATNFTEMYHNNMLHTIELPWMLERVIEKVYHKYIGYTVV